MSVAIIDERELQGSLVIISLILHDHLYNIFSCHVILPLEMKCLNGSGKCTVFLHWLPPVVMFSDLWFLKAGVCCCSRILFEHPCFFRSLDPSLILFHLLTLHTTPQTHQVFFRQDFDVIIITQVFHWAIKDDILHLLDLCQSQISEKHSHLFSSRLAELQFFRTIIISWKLMCQYEGGKVLCFECFHVDWDSFLDFTLAAIDLDVEGVEMKPG